MHKYLQSMRDYLYYNTTLLFNIREFNTFRETFRDQQYKWLYNRIKPNTTLLDIGAALGDTAIYFAMHPNVRKVISFECDIEQYRKAKENINRASFDKKIKLYHSTVNSLEWILNIAESPIAIKCDIEGDEYKIFTDDLDLHKVYVIMMEYHYMPERLIKILKSEGFKIKYTKPRKIQGYETGFIYAER